MAVSLISTNCYRIRRVSKVLENGLGSKNPVTKSIQVNPPVTYSSRRRIVGILQTKLQNSPGPWNWSQSGTGPHASYRPMSLSVVKTRIPCSASFPPQSNECKPGEANLSFFLEIENVNFLYLTLLYVTNLPGQPRTQFVRQPSCRSSATYQSEEEHLLVRAQGALCVRDIVADICS